MKKTILSLLMAAVFTSGAFGLYEGAATDVMIQGFHWTSWKLGWWTNMNAKAADIANAGFTIVWFAPHTKAASDEGYLPTEWYNLTSKYGNQAQLVAVISNLHSKNVKSIADIILNHRCGTLGWGDFTNPAFADNFAAVCRDDEWGQGTGGYDMGDPWSSGRDLDHNNWSVQKEITNYMLWLKNTIKFDGWRYDMPKGFPGSFTAKYNDASKPYFSVGEYFDGDRQKLCDWIDSTGSKSTAFDFSTKFILQGAVKNSAYYNLKDGAGKASGLIGWWPSMAVTFIDNHDTGMSPGGGQNHDPFPSDKLMEGYAYILTHPGIPCVYWPHYFDLGSAMQTEIKNLIQLRKAMGLKSTSTLSIVAADSSKYAALVDNKVYVKIGPGSWNPGTGWLLALSGLNYAVWTNGSGGGGTGIRTVVYMLKETVTGQDIFIKGGHDAGLVPGVYPSMSEPIQYLNTKNATTAAIKAADASLDWGSESALDWTCNAWPASWGTKKTYAVDGYGEDPENTFGLHYWKFDVMMTGNAGEWFEFKAFMRQNGTEWWENNISQSGTPYSTINHWGKKGYKTVTSYGGNAATFYPL